MVKIILHAVLIGLSALLLTRLNLNTFFMRFFRDLARSKARRRLYGNKHALVPMLLGMDTPMLKTSDDEAAEDQMIAFTLDELKEYDGSNDESPLYLSIMGRVYDVSAGRRFYGEEGDYHGFVGRDATRAFGTGCLMEECMVSNTEGLSEKERKEIERWVELYETHDKYTFVGKLVDDVVDQILLEEEEEDHHHQQHDLDEVEEQEEESLEEEGKEAIAAD